MTWERLAALSERTKHMQLECLLRTQEVREAREASAHRQCLIKGVQTNILASSEPAWSTYLWSRCRSYRTLERINSEGASSHQLRGYLR